MKVWKAIGITALMLAGVSWSGFVQAAYIDQRGIQQQQWIQEGIQSGAITPREAERLQAEQQRIQVTKDQMMAKGRMTPNEKVMLDQMQADAGQNIYRLINNNQANFHRYENHRHEPPWMAERQRYWREKRRHHNWED